MTLFGILYGRKPPTITRYVKDATSNSIIENQLLEWDATLRLLKDNLLKAQERMTITTNKHRRDVQFHVGDWVYVKLQPFRQGSVRLQRHYKLDRRYFGPYQITSTVGSVAYKVALLDTAKIHNVFHVSLLRKCMGKPEQQVTPIELVNSDITFDLQPLSIQDHHTVHRGGQVIDQYLVTWQGLLTTAATWEDKTLLVQNFPNLHLADKVDLKGEGNVMNEKGPESQKNETVMVGTGKLRKSTRVRKLPAKLRA